MKALVYGGAFNPPTRAHIELADFSRKEVNADKVVFVPSKMRYIQEDQKKDFAFSDEDRLHMLRSIAAEHPWMEVSDYELLLKEQPRTYTTMCFLRDQGYECSLLFGSDKLTELEYGWKHVEDICREFGICCMARNNDCCEDIIDNDPYLRTLKPYITIIHTPADFQGFSSTKVRKLYLEAAEKLKDIMTMVPSELDGLKEYLFKEGSL